MAEIITMGEIIVEIMRAKEDEPLYTAGTFKGPYPSGAPAIFIDTVARLGHSAKIIGGVGKDDFGKCLLDRLSGDGVDVSDVIENNRISTGCAFVTYFADGSRKFIFHIGNTPDIAVGTSILYLIPGVPYINVVSDMLDHHYLCAFSRFIDACILTACLSLGLCFGMLILKIEWF